MNEFDSKFYKIVGKRIRDLRLQNKTTLLDLANKLGVTTKTIQRYEMGDRKIDVPQLTRIATALGTTCEQIMLDVQKEQYPASLEPATVVDGGFSETEELLLKLFHQVPLEQQELVLRMIEAALKTQGLL